jgi:hypothetical protein
MIPFLGMAGLTMDVGHTYVIQKELQNGTNAAALAAGGYLFFNGATYTSEGDAYASGSGEANPVAYVTGTTVTPICVNILIAKGGTACTASSSNADPNCKFLVCNAIKVVQTASVPTYFLRAVGWNTLNVEAVAVSSMSGPAQPWNVAIIMDATGSMANSDSNASSCPSQSTQFQCALTGIQTLLSGMNPCPTGYAGCTDAQANLHVALFTFPNIRTDLLNIANACAANPYADPGPLPYTVLTLPKPGLARYFPDKDLIYKQTYQPAAGGNLVPLTWSASYEITYEAADADANGFVSDYYEPSDTATGGLNPASSIIMAIGYGGNGASGTTLKNGCLPIAYSGVALNTATPTPAAGPPAGTEVNTTDVGEGITYYAPAIYAAQAALTAESVLHPKAQDAIIILGDGEMNTQWIYLPQGSLLQKSQVPIANNNTAAPSAIVPNATNCGNGTIAGPAGNFADSSCGWSTALSPAGTATTPAGGTLAAALLASPANEVIGGLGAVVGKYPDFMDECQQSIAAAQYATAAGTRVYAVAYGSESKGCSSTGESKSDDYNDVSLVLPMSNPTPNVTFSLAQLTPCVTMENIASSLEWFYSDWEVSGGSSTCQGTANSMTSLDDIFAAIKASLSQARLLPQNAS